MNYVFLGLLLGAALVFPWVARLDRRPWILILPLVVVESLLEAVAPWGRRADLALQFGSVSVYPTDLVVALVIGTVIVRFARGRRPPLALAFALAALVAILAVNFLRGLSSFGLETAANGLRKELALVAGLALGASLAATRDQLRAFRWSWVVAALATAGVWLALIVTGVSSDRPDLPFGWRVLPASAAPVILVGSLSFPLGWKPLRLRLVSIAAAAALLAVVLLNEVRASWVAAVTGLGSSLAAVPRRWRRWAVALALILGVALVGFLAWADVPFASAVRALVTQAIAPGGASTGSWRLENWRALVDLQVSRGPAAVIAGVPLGSDTTRPLASGGAISVVAHNFLLDLWVSGGLVAAGAFLAVSLLGGWGLLRRASRDRYALWFLMASVAVFTYGMAWSLTGSLGCFLGAAFTYGIGGGEGAALTGTSEQEP